MKEKGLLVALSGQMYSGKTTASKIFVESGAWERIRFAGFFKSMVYNFLVLSGYDKNIANECIDGSLKQTRLPDLDVTTRWMLQMIGSEFPAFFNYPNIWSNLTMARANTLRKTTNVIIDDLRFIHEDTDIKKHDGVTILISGNHETVRKKDEINNLYNIYLHDKYISDEKFIKNMLLAWNNTFGNMGLDRIQKDINSIFEQFVNDILIKGRGKHDTNYRNHVSENSFPKTFDYMIENNGTIYDLKDKVESLIIRLGHRKES